MNTRDLTLSRLSREEALKKGLLLDNQKAANQNSLAILDKWIMSSPLTWRGLSCTSKCESQGKPPTYSSPSILEFSLFLNFPHDSVVLPWSGNYSWITCDDESKDWVNKIVIESRLNVTETSYNCKLVRVVLQKHGYCNRIHKNPLSFCDSRSSTDFLQVKVSIASFQRKTSPKNRNREQRKRREDFREEDSKVCRSANNFLEHARRAFVKSGIRSIWRKIYAN